MCLPQWSDCTVQTHETYVSYFTVVELNVRRTWFVVLSKLDSSGGVVLLFDHVIVAWSNENKIVIIIIIIIITVVIIVTNASNSISKIRRCWGSFIQSRSITSTDRHPTENRSAMSLLVCRCIEKAVGEHSAEETGQRLRQVHSGLHGKELGQLRQRLRRRVCR